MIPGHSQTGSETVPAAGGVAWRVQTSTTVPFSDVVSPPLPPPPSSADSMLVTYTGSRHVTAFSSTPAVCAPDIAAAGVPAAAGMANHVALTCRPVAHHVRYNSFQAGAALARHISAAPHQPAGHGLAAQSLVAAVAGTQAQYQPIVGQQGGPPTPPFGLQLAQQMAPFGAPPSVEQPAMQRALHGAREQPAPVATTAPASLGNSQQHLRQAELYLSFSVQQNTDAATGISSAFNALGEARDHYLGLLSLQQQQQQAGARETQLALARHAYIRSSELLAAALSLCVEAGQSCGEALHHNLAAAAAVLCAGQPAQHFEGFGAAMALAQLQLQDQLRARFAALQQQTDVQRAINAAAEKLKAQLHELGAALNPPQQEQQMMQQQHLGQGLGQQHEPQAVPSPSPPQPADGASADAGAAPMQYQAHGAGDQEEPQQQQRHPEQHHLALQPQQQLPVQPPGAAVADAAQLLQAAIFRDLEVLRPTARAAVMSGLQEVGRLWSAAAGGGPAGVRSQLQQQQN